MQVQALPLEPGVSLTLVFDQGAWRFASWMRRLQMIAPPPDSDLAKRFETVEDAAAHFRAIYPRERA